MSGGQVGSGTSPAMSHLGLLFSKKYGVDGGLLLQFYKAVSRVITLCSFSKVYSIVLNINN